VLCRLRKAPGGRLRMAELAEHALLSRSGMTRLIDRLEREGMVSRSSCDKDGRGCYAVLTDEGRAALEQARSTHISVVRAGFLRHFSVDELRDLAGLLQRVL
jgi:DNA-binding MarR family transcriptional regulator